MDRRSPIRDIRKSHNLSQEQLAKMLGVSRSTVAKYELGDIDPPMRVLGQMSAIFQCSLDDLIDVHDFFDSEDEEKAFRDAEKSIQTAFQESENPGELFDSLVTDLLLKAFDGLNKKGKAEAVKLLYKLVADPKYQRKPQEGEQSAVDPQENQ